MTFRTNVHAMFWMARAAVPQHAKGRRHHQYGLDQLRRTEPHTAPPCDPQRSNPQFYGRAGAALAKAGIRVNAVAPGLEWTPLIPSTMPPETGANSGINVPMKRAAQPGELATAYVMLADPRSRYTSGATIAVTGGKPFL